MKSQYGYSVSTGDPLDWLWSVLMILACLVAGGAVIWAVIEILLKGPQ
jgi:hypothetical protein